MAATYPRKGSEKPGEKKFRASAMVASWNCKGDKAAVSQGLKFRHTEHCHPTTATCVANAARKAPAPAREPPRASRAPQHPHGPPPRAARARAAPRRCPAAPCAFPASAPSAAASWPGSRSQPARRRRSRAPQAARTPAPPTPRQRAGPRPPPRPPPRRRRRAHLGEKLCQTPRAHAAAQKQKSLFADRSEFRARVLNLGLAAGQRARRRSGARGGVSAGSARWLPAPRAACAPWRARR